MSNVDAHRSAHEAFNRRDYEAAVQNFRDGLEYTDHPRNITTKGSAEFISWMQGWVAAFSDAQVADVRYIDGDDHSVAIFQGRGTNDGAMGPLPATGKRLDMPIAKYSDTTRRAGRFPARCSTTPRRCWFSSASWNPCRRPADRSSLSRRAVQNRPRYRQITAGLEEFIDGSNRACRP
jgi:hypothetical protein